VDLEEAQRRQSEAEALVAAARADISVAAKREAAAAKALERAESLMAVLLRRRALAERDNARNVGRYQEQESNLQKGLRKTHYQVALHDRQVQTAEKAVILLDGSVGVDRSALRTAQHKLENSKQLRTFNRREIARINEKLLLEEEERHGEVLGDVSYDLYVPVPDSTQLLSLQLCSRAAVPLQPRLQRQLLLLPPPLPPPPLSERLGNGARGAVSRVCTCILLRDN